MKKFDDVLEDAIEVAWLDHVLHFRNDRNAALRTIKERAGAIAVQLTNAIDLQLRQILDHEITSIAEGFLNKDHETDLIRKRLKEKQARRRKRRKKTRSKLK